MAAGTIWDRVGEALLSNQEAEPEIKHLHSAVWCGNTGTMLMVLDIIAAHEEANGTQVFSISGDEKCVIFRSKNEEARKEVVASILALCNLARVTP